MQDAPTSDLARAGLVVGGKFRLDACIGEGGMGSVWRATHLGLGNQIAIKLISREFVQSPEALRRFDSEAKAAARLQSRHVVQVYDNGTLDDGTPYIAMELLTGESLQQRIDRSGPLPIQETVDILAQCCKALGRAHSVGIIHRDIKPDNIYLSRSPDDDVYIVKVLDFGVAKMTMAGSGDQGSTKTGAVVGTPLYMSPEQARGLRNVDHRTDLYSLGIVAYTMVTGRIAFYGESFGDILLKICTEPIPTLRISADIPPSLDPWMQYVCARDPAQRCASAQEFIDSLRAAVGIRAATSAAMSAPFGGQHAAPAPPAATDSDAPWRLPPAPVAQSVGETVAQSAGETSVAMSAGVPRARAKTNIAVILSAIAGLALSSGIAFFAVSMRHSSSRSTESGQVTTAAAAAPQAAPPAPPPNPPSPMTTTPTATPSASAAPSAKLAPLAVDPAMSASASPARSSATPTAAGPPHHAALPTQEAHPPVPPHATPQAPPTAASKPPNSVDLGY